MRQDELKHFDQFSYLYETYTGRKYAPKFVEESHEEYLDMLKVVFEKEQEAVDEYLELSDLPLQSHIRRVFRRAAADEQNHAVWVLAFLTERKMKENFRFNDKWYI
ncbi:MAG: ferritin-like domain-containing protein [Bacillus sp. (in: Bacteria)]|nr:ferritin-like domain-containing protein [Bacillus sp. (in: firmicutes)]